MKVEVRPIKVKKWHGKEGKESFTQSKTIEVLVNAQTGQFDTGLTPEETEKYSKLLGVDLSPIYNPNEAHPYWSTKAASIKLENKTMLFDPINNADFVKIKNLKASKYVANSLQEFEQGLYPNATHVIFDEEAEVTKKASGVQLKNKAIQFSLKMSADEKTNIIQILSGKSVRGRSTNFIDVEIDNLVQDSPEQFLKYSKMDKNEVYVRAAILECIHRNILTKEGLAIHYMGDVIGLDFETAVEWFSNPQNQKMKVAILEKLNS